MDTFVTMHPRYSSESSSLRSRALSLLVEGRFQVIFKCCSQSAFVFHSSLYQ